MDFATGEKNTAQIIRAIIGLKGMNVAQLACALGTTRQNLAAKLKRNNFSEKELRQIAAALGYELILQFKEKEV